MHHRSQWELSIGSKDALKERVSRLLDRMMEEPLCKTSKIHTRLIFGREFPGPRLGEREMALWPAGFRRVPPPCHCTMRT